MRGSPKRIWFLSRNLHILVGIQSIFKLTDAKAKSSVEILNFIGKFDCRAGILDPKAEPNSKKLVTETWLPTGFWYGKGFHLHKFRFNQTKPFLIYS